MFWRSGRAGAIWLLSLIQGSDAEGGGTRWGERDEWAGGSGKAWDVSGQSRVASHGVG